MVERLANVVNRLSRESETNTTTRRGFLGRLTLTAAALSVAPVRYITRPASARALVTCRLNSTACSPAVTVDCPSGSLCCTDYTAFCCTLTGNNQCPTGTVVGGWWKCSYYPGSGLCDAQNYRYYLDCNSQCTGCTTGCTPCTGDPANCSPNGNWGSAVCCDSCDSFTCRCANGSCGNRKTACNKFRYGQCHNNFTCLGPVVCRVVTCTYPPNISGWRCSTVYQQDDNTCCHSATCLPASC